MKKKIEFFELSEREKTTLPVAIILLVIAGVLRVETHLANVTPFFAVTILVGFLLGKNRALLAGALSATAMLAGDLVLGLHETMLFVYFGLALAALIGASTSELIQGQKSWIGRTGWSFVTSGLASTVFFIVSNIGVWLVGDLYPLTADGLNRCFLMAIPFFRQSLSTDLICGTVLIVATAKALEMARLQSSSAVQNVKVGNGR